MVDIQLKVPDMGDQADIVVALNEYFYGQDNGATTVVPNKGIAGGLLTVENSISSLSKKVDNRISGKMIVDSTNPGNPTASGDYVGGIWVDTSTPQVSGSPLNIMKYWDKNANSGAGAWVAATGIASQDYSYTWTKPHIFKSTINYLESADDIDTAFGTTKGTIAVIANKLKVRESSKWSDISLPIGGTSGQVMSKVSATDFDVTWSDVVTPTGSHTLSGTNTFSGNVTFTKKPTMNSGLTVSNDVATFNKGVSVASGSTVTIASPTTISNTLSVSGNTSVGGTLGVTGASTLTGSLTVSGITTMNNAVNVPNDASRQTGLFIGTKRVWVSSGVPSGAVEGDIWIQA